MVMKCLAAILAAALIVVGVARADAPQVYTFDNKHTDIRFTYGVGFVSHSGHFTEVDGTIVYDARAPERGGMDAVIKSASLSANSFETELKSSDFFDVAVFPEIRFKSRSVTPTGGHTATFLGDLTMKGVTKPAVLQVVLDPTDAAASSRGSSVNRMLRMKAVGRISRSAFNMTALGFLVGDDIEIQIDAVLKMG